MSSKFLANLVCFSLVFTASASYCDAAQIKGGKIWPDPGEKEDRSQSNRYVTVFARSNGSVQVFFHDPDTDKLVQKVVAADQSIRISYWDMKGQKISQQIRGQNAAAEGNLAAATGSMPSRKPAGSAPEAKAEAESKPALAESSLPETKTEEAESKPSVAESALPETKTEEAESKPSVAESALPETKTEEAESKPSLAESALPETKTETESKPALVETPVPETKAEEKVAAPLAEKSSAPEGDDFETQDTPEPQSSVSSLNPSSAAGSAASSAYKDSKFSGPVRPSSGLQALAVPSITPKVPSVPQDAVSETASIPTPIPTGAAASTPPSSAQSSIAPGDNYLAAVDTPLGPCVWKRFPIKVFMPAAPVSYGKQLESDVREAFETWSKLSQNKLSFEFVPGSGAADMVLAWAASKASLRDKSESGEANVSYSTTGSGRRTAKNPGDITHAKITFVLVDINNKAWAPGELRTVALHEIGHALGLMGHSKNASDIMYHQKNSVTEPSARDLNTLNQLYQTVFEGR